MIESHGLAPWSPRAESWSRAKCLPCRLWWCPQRWQLWPILDQYRRTLCRKRSSRKSCQPTLSATQRPLLINQVTYLTSLLSFSFVCNKSFYWRSFVIIFFSFSFSSLYIVYIVIYIMTFLYLNKLSSR